MNGKWKWTTVPLMLALVSTPLAWSGDAPGEEMAPGVEGVTAGAGVPVVDDEVTGRERVLAIAGQVGQWQLGVLGETPETTPTIDVQDAHQALGLFAERHGAELAVTDAVALRLLDDKLDETLTDVVVALLVLEDESHAAFGDLDPDAVRADPWAVADEVRLAGVVAAQERLLEATLDLQELLETRSGRLPVPVAVPGVFLLSLTGMCEDDVYTQDAPLIIDECGNDRYLNNGGGASLLSLGSSSCSMEIPLVAAAVVDFDGDDVFGNGRNCGANGGGYLGAGFLYDAGGDDLYSGAQSPGLQVGNDGVNGGAVGGAGMLVDNGGSDRYVAGGWGTNGGGYPGARGLLIDMDGKDVYQGSFDAVNGGGLGGVGALWDEAGDDVYTAWASGVNGGATGGGLLYDRSGRDLYDDNAGGHGVDVTVVPKETNGFQIDEDG